MGDILLSGGGHVTIDSGTVTANQGTPAVVANKWPVEIVDSGGVNIATVTATNAVKVDGSAVTQPVSGTITANQGTATAVGGGWPIQYDRPTSANLSSASINVSASGDNTLITGVGGQTIRVFQLFFVVNGSVNVKFKDGAATDLTGVMNMVSNGSFVLDLSNEPWFVTSTANAFVLNLSGAVQVSGRIYYKQS